MVSGSGVCAKRIVVDARYHMLGRLSSIIVNELLNNQKVVVAHCEEICLSAGSVLLVSRLTGSPTRWTQGYP
jgi:ribosomal protein L13